MDVAPPPASGLRMQEVGDRLVVSFRPRRSRLVFLSVWLLGWTFGGVMAWLQVPNADPVGAIFLLFWLCGWFLGECGVGCIIAWQLFGRVTVAVSPDVLELRRKLFGFCWLRRYEAARVEEITIGQMPAGDGGPRKDYSLSLSYAGQTVWIGEGMGEREAEYVASVVRSRIGRTSWWNDASGTQPRTAVDPNDTLQLGAPARAKAVLVSAVVIAALTLLVVPIARRSLRRHQQSVEPTQPATALPPIPIRDNFSSAREYAEAVTSWALKAGRSVSVSRPHCDPHSTWTHWSCGARVGSDARTRATGRAMPYRCRSESPGSLTCRLTLEAAPDR